MKQRVRIIEAEGREILTLQNYFEEIILIIYKIKVKQRAIFDRRENIALLKLFFRIIFK